jgi:hypothetical protein
MFVCLYMHKSNIKEYINILYLYSKLVWLLLQMAKVAGSDTWTHSLAKKRKGVE